MSCTSLVEMFDSAPLNNFHKRLAIYSSGGPLLDGYVLSIIGIALVQATPYLGLSLFWEGMIGASALIGIFLGGFVGGWFTDKFGRQVLYTLDLVAIGVFSLAQFWVESAESLFFCRLFLGIAVGADYPIATALLAEFAPKKYRGPLTGMLNVMWFVGAALGYIVGGILLHMGPDAWRWMLASAALPTAIFIFLRRNTPESPRWLRRKGRYLEAKAVLKQVYGQDVSMQELESITTEPKPVGIAALFRAGYGTRMIFVSVFWTCTIVPLFAVYAFSPKILTALGLTGDLSNMGSVVITILFMLGTIFALSLVNKIGRRALLLQSFFWTSLALLLLGIFANGTQYVILLLFAAYALTTGGSQILQFIYPNELFPTEIRASAVGLASSLSRIGAAVGTYLVPLALVRIGIGATMLVAAAITLAGFVVSYKMAPETMHCSLEDAASLAQ